MAKGLKKVCGFTSRLFEVNVFDIKANNQIRKY